MRPITAIALGLIVAASNGAYAQSGDYAADHAPAKITPATGHGPLAGKNGMTLYRFDDDSAGVLNCYDGCAASWPRYVVGTNSAVSGDGFTQIERRDGTVQ